MALAENSAIAMRWEINEKQSSIGFYPVNSEIDTDFLCDKELFARLDAKTQTSFRRVDDEFYYYSKLNHDYEKTENFSPVPKLIYSGIPEKISVAELADIIKTQKVIFYTGAGISAGAVPVMDELMENLKLFSALAGKIKLENYVADVINNSDFYTKIMENFFNRCENAEPTVAHQELAKIINAYQYLLLTENVDKLHQKTGIEPTIFPEFSQKFADINADYLITIGLNTDESGFLFAYKKQNPLGKIISINLVDTCYLSCNDYSLKGDAQIIMKQLGEMI
jgi:NAD-dependent deacetylase